MVFCPAQRAKNGLAEDAYFYRKIIFSDEVYFYRGSYVDKPKILV